MSRVHKLSTSASSARAFRLNLGRTRCASTAPAHLLDMDATPRRTGDLESIYSLSELAEHLGVPVQTLYDLRHQGRGRRGFRVGRELRFRASEVQAWLTALEARDVSRQRSKDRA